MQLRVCAMLSNKNYFFFVCILFKSTGANGDAQWSLFYIDDGG
jgi:hypothetical protein